MKFRYLLLITTLICAFACKQNSKTEAPTVAPEIAPQAKPTSPSFTLLWETDSIFKIPESCLYDAKRNRIYVSNVDGKPRDIDNQGFISTLSKEGTLLKLDWATGMSAPKGMGLYEDTLYATDIDAIVAIDANTGKITARYPLEGAKMLNDLTVDAQGTLYFSAMDTNRIFSLKDGKIELWKDQMNKPNGVLALGNQLLVASMGEGTLKAYDVATKKLIKEHGSNMGAGDGLVQLNSGAYVMSDWRGEIFYVNNGEVTSLYNTIDQKLQTADIGIIPGEDVVLIPTFFGNGVKAYKFEE